MSESFTLGGFGTLKVAGRSTREGQNPGAGNKMALPAQKTARLMPEKRLKEAVGRPVAGPYGQHCAVFARPGTRLPVERLY